MRNKPVVVGPRRAWRVWCRQCLACGLAFLLRARVPGPLLVSISSLRSDGLRSAAAEALQILGVDGFGLLCVVSFTQQRSRGLALLGVIRPIA
jgi:hypothetical protein